MNFMTTEYVKIEAKLGEIPSIEASLLHHQQGRDANYPQFVSAVIAGKYDVKDAFCACCLRFKSTHSRACADEHKNVCPLFDESNDKHHCCDGAWKQLKNAFDDFKVDMSLANFKAFQTAEGKICTYISGVLEKKKAEAKRSPCLDCPHAHPNKPKAEPESKKESKPALTYTIGDRFIDDSGIKRMLVAVCNTGCKEVAWVELKSGHCSNISVKDWHNITPKEISPYIDGYTRYWDSQKEELLDLAQRAEDLEEFEVENSIYEEINVYMRSDEQIWIKQGTDKILLDRKSQDIFHQKLGQMIATAKRKQKSK